MRNTTFEGTRESPALGVNSMSVVVLKSPSFGRKSFPFFAMIFTVSPFG
jgi:hypothetical protein